MSQVARPSFTDVLSHKEYRSVFLEHLRSNFCEEYMLFLDKVEEYRQQFNPRLRFSLGVHIINFFIRQDKIPLNISSDEKQSAIDTFMKSLATWALPTDIFDYLYTQVKMQLQADQFPLFEQGEAYSKMSKTAIEEARRTQSVDQQELSRQSISTSADQINNLIVTAQDFDQRRQQLEQEDWQLVSSTPHSKVYRSKFKQQNGIYVFKADSKLQCDLLTWAAVIADNQLRKRVNHVVIEAQTLDYILGDGVKNLPTSVQYDAFRLPFPFKNRDSICASTLRYVEEKRQFEYVSKPVDYPLHKSKDKLIRYFPFGYQVCRELDATTCEVTMMFSAELGGTTPNWISNKALVKVGKEYPFQFKKLVDYYKQKQTL